MQKTESKQTITIVDEHDKQIGKTYPKRANGLIKNKRARYIDENKIMLIACPSDEYIMEENKMNNNELNNNKLNNNKLDIQYIIDKIDAILANNNEILNVIKDFDEQDVFENVHHPIQKIINTNNELIGLLKELIKPYTVNETENKKYVLEVLSDALQTAVQNDAQPEVVREIIESIKKFEL